MHCKKSYIKKKEALDSLVPYKGERKKYEIEQKWKIIQGSFEEQMITVWMERGASFKSATRVYNAEFRAKHSLPRIGVTAICNAMYRCNHMFQSTTAIPQTDSNNLLHRQARFNWFSQFLVRMGVALPTLSENEEESEFSKRLDKEW